MEPLPNLNKAFSLVFQEERHKVIPINIPTDIAAFSASGRVDGGTEQHRRRRYCTYCDKIGHTKDTCYILHGHPDNYSRRPNVPKSAHAATVDNASCDSSATDVLPASTSSPPLPPLTQAKYHQLLSFLNSEASPHSANFSGMPSCFSILSSTSWVIDSGASLHFSNSVAPTMLSVSSSQQQPVCLPNGTILPITHIGTHHLSTYP
ncbi:hypothetical protein NE237_027789 [Protea cynaroides]|uniref:Uncharacterized protein n=1 Tax=Protea cynaroides TaxID=273540 RepID=A0A9Q0JTI2_9MAGN|nr:hypothetical protein NE237_027789 [Protea cynaroides]